MGTATSSTALADDAVARAIRTFRLPSTQAVRPTRELSAARLRRGEIRIADEEITVLSESVADVGVGLVLSNFPQSSPLREDAAFGTWRVQRR